MAGDLAALRREARERFERSRGAAAGTPAQGLLVPPPPGPGGPVPAPATASSPSSARKARADDPEEAAAILEAGGSTAVLHAIEVLTAPRQHVRGCRVDPSRPCLQALQNVLGWTQGGYDTRPTEAVAEQKFKDRVQVLLTYRQPPPPPAGEKPHVVMYDYLADTLFGIPMRPVGPEVVPTEFQDLEGRIVTPSWIEADWEAFAASGARRPEPVFMPNRYPYQLPCRPAKEGAHEFQRQTQHWILWYLHLPPETLADPVDEVIEDDVRTRLMEVVSGQGLEAFDYIWYRNPAMSTPDVFHVQVFWIVPEA